jgi:hypothetical protein
MFAAQPAVNPNMPVPYPRTERCLSGQTHTQNAPPYPKHTHIFSGLYMTYRPHFYGGHFCFLSIFTQAMKQKLQAMHPFTSSLNGLILS